MDSFHYEPSGWEDFENNYRASANDRPARSEAGNPEDAPAFTRGLNPMNIEALLDHDFPPPEHVLQPWLNTQALAMIHAMLGVGKTHVAAGVACAIAGGTSFLRWSAPKPRRVLVIDGEMPGKDLQQRYASTIVALNIDVPAENLLLVASDFEPDGLPDLANEAAQQFYDAVVEQVEVIVVDNISTVCRSLRENEADSWGPIQQWALRLRRNGKTVVFVHHQGKGGGQRGTSKKEDILNTVIALRHPPDYVASQGARFEVHYEKARGFFGSEAEPFEAWLRDGQWHIDSISRSADDETISTLRDQGLSQRDIAARTGLSKSTISRRLKEMT